jgi:hypothetical protein
MASANLCFSLCASTAIGGDSYYCHTMIGVYYECKNCVLGNLHTGQSKAKDSTFLAIFIVFSPDSTVVSLYNTF